VLSDPGHIPPPHDLVAEEAALGAGLASSKGATQVASASAEDFYDPKNKLIAQAIQSLYNDSKPTDSTLVRAELDRSGRLEAAGGDERLAHLLINAPSYSAEHYLKIVRDHATLRRYIANADRGLAFAYSKQFDDVAQIAADSAEIFSKVPDDLSSWAFTDLWPVMIDDEVSDAPALLSRSDGQCLLYPGRVHAFNAETESGKSWIALYSCVQEIEAENHVVYIDFEDQAKGITDRLKDLGLTQESIHEFFHYTRPSDAISAQSKELIKASVESMGPTLVIIDGVTEVMAMNSWSIIDNDDVAKFLEALPRPIARLGPAVVLIDHVVKNKEGRGKFGIGGQHKLAGIDGAAFGLEVLRPFGRERDGLARIVITKDRPGHLYKAATDTKVVAHMRLLSLGGQVNLALVCPDGAGDDDHSPRLELMEKITRHMEYQTEPQSKNAIRKAVTGASSQIIEAIMFLVDGGHLAEADSHGGYPRYILAKPFSAKPAPEITQERWETEDF